MNKYKEFLNDLIKKYPFSFSQILVKRYPAIMQYLIDTYPLLNGHPISEYIYWEINNLKEFPKCHNSGCPNNVKFINIKHGYQKCCSISCTNKSSEHIAKVNQTRANDPDFWKKRGEVSAQTKLDRYGDKNYCNPEKAKATRYVKNNGHYHADDFVLKTKSSKKNRYGDENYCNSELAKQTVAEKIAEDPLYYKKRDSKAKATTAIRYNNENYRNIDQAKKNRCSQSWWDFTPTNRRIQTISR